MVWYNKVSWSEGLFLSPQMFQQQERYLEQQAHRRCEPLGALFWGFQALRIETGALASGRLQLSHARGVWPDGLAFDIPALGRAPAALRIEAAHVGRDILLALPPSVAQSQDVCFADQPPGAARHEVFDAELQDVQPLGHGARSVQLLGQLPRLVPAPDLPEGWMALAVARIAALRPDGSAELDPQRLPPCTAIEASEVLVRWLADVHAQIVQRASTVAQRLTGESRMQSPDVADFLLLQLLNAHDSRLGHMIGLGRAAPERVYALLASLDAELSTYLRGDTRRPIELPAYVHADPGAGFVPLLADLRDLLHRTVRRGAEPIALREESHGMRVATIDPSELRDFSALVIAVAADIESDALRQQFATQAKVGPVERLPELVRLHLPGIALRSLSRVPRQIPYRSEQVHFQLEAEGALWQQLLASGGIGIHLAVEFPGLALQLWGLR
jgi:type VI secretion system protein ImpJ